MKRILITGAGGAPSTNFVRSLRMASEKFYLVGCDANPYYLMRAETDTRYLVPKVNESKFLPIIQDLIKKERIEFVHIQNDDEIGWFSKHRNQISAKLFLPSQKTISICQNKYQSYLRWANAKLTIPKTVTLKSPSDLKIAFKKLGSDIWLRSTTGAAGRGSLSADNYESAKAWIDFHRGWGTFTAAERLTDTSITWMSLWHSGTLIVAQGRKRLYWEMAKVAASGITGVTGAGETVNDSLLDSIATSAIKAIDKKPHGLFGVDLTYDRNGIPNPTEINIGRFFTTHLFFTQAGINMPYIYVQLAFGKKPRVPKINVNPIIPGRIWIRGVDFLPVLTDRSIIESHKANLAKRIASLES